MAVPDVRADQDDGEHDQSGANEAGDPTSR
jgi:hypothetical protein